MVSTFGGPRDVPLCVVDKVVSGRDLKTSSGGRALRALGEVGGGRRPWIFFFSLCRAGHAYG